MSLSATSDVPLFESACAAAAEAGGLGVAAAGNSGGGVEYPAKYDSVIAVGATDDANAVPSWSCGGGELELVAPGVDILSTIPSRLVPGGQGRAVGFLSGTSMASPFVAAAAALVLTVHPSWTPAQVAKRLTDSASDLTFTGDAPGYDVYTGFGLLDAARAVGN